jgi:hypothetical protein
MYSLMHPDTETVLETIWRLLIHQRKYLSPGFNQTISWFIFKKKKIIVPKVKNEKVAISDTD